MNNFSRFACVIGLLVGLAACGGSSTEDHIATAKNFITDSEYESAVIELKNALQQDAEAAEARWLLGKIYLESGDVPSAEKELRRALELGSPRSDVLPPLAECWLALGEYAQIEELSLKQLDTRAEASLLATKALAAIAQGDRYEAEDLVNRALEKDPGSRDVLLVKAQVLAVNGDLAAVELVLDDLIALYPEYAPVWSLLGNVLMAQGETDEALAAFDKAVTYQPNNYGTRFKRAMLYLQLQNYDAAQADTKAILRIAPRNQGANYVQGLIHFQAGRYGEAITALSVAEPAFNEFPLVLYYLASAQLLEANLDQASMLAGRYSNIAPQSLRGRKLLATIRLRQGKHQQVQELLTPVLDARPDDVEALNLMANALLIDGKTEEGINLLSRVAELRPESSVAQIKLGAGLLRAGQADSAEQHIQTALELNPEFQQADIMLVMKHVQAQEYDAALEAAQAYRRRNLTSTTPLNLLGRVYLAAGRKDEAREAFQKALTLDAGDPSANQNLARMAMAAQDPAAAREYFDAILAERENYLSALLGLAALDAAQGDEQSRVKRLELAMEAHPAAMQPRLLLGRYYLDKGRPDQVAPLFTSLDKQQKQSAGVIQLMAMAQLANEDGAAAQDTLEQLAESTPDSALIHHMMAMAAFEEGDGSTAQLEFRRALEVDEDYVPSRIGLARMALATGRMDEFGQHVAKLESLAPDDPRVLRYRAVLAYKNGDHATAVKLSRQAFTLAPGTATVLALASQQLAAGDREGAFQLLRTWIEEHPEDIAVSVRLASSLQKAGNMQESMSLYEKIAQLDPENVVALNNLAWNLREDEPARALEYARRASEIAPDSADVLDTLAVVEYMNKDYTRAQRHVERALRKNPENPSMLYHSAMIAAALDDKTGARTTLEQLLAVDTDFPEIAAAKALLVQLSQ